MRDPQDSFDAIYITAMMTSYFDAGLYPNMVAIHDVNRDLAALPPDEARRMRRKFRKIWRRIRSQRLAEVSFGHRYRTVMHDMGWPNMDPTPNQRWFRKAAVKEELMTPYTEALKRLDRTLRRKNF